MRTFATLEELAAEQGNELGISDWMTVDQDRIDGFAEATGDRQWIHVDPDRARTELGMSTIAHGYLTMSLVAKFVQEIFTVTSVRRIVNYGANKIRFMTMVPVNSRLRGRVELVRASLGTGTLRAICEVTVEIEGGKRPAMKAETITLFYE